jgi:hypothetical protein
VVELGGDGVEVGLGVGAQVAVLGEVLAQEPVVFSLEPRWEGLRGSQKETGTAVAMLTRAWWAICLPWSQVMERRSWVGAR